MEITEEVKTRAQNKLTASPNPVRPGGTISIKGKPSSYVFVGKKGKVTRLLLDAKGKGSVQATGEPGDEIVISDCGIPPANVVVKIVSTITAPMPLRRRT